MEGLHEIQKITQYIIKAIYLKIGDNINKKKISILLQKLNTRCPNGLSIVECKDVK